MSLIITDQEIRTLALAYIKDRKGMYNFSEVISEEVFPTYYKVRFKLVHKFSGEIEKQRLTFKLRDEQIEIHTAVSYCASKIIAYIRIK